MNCERIQPASGPERIPLLKKRHRAEQIAAKLRQADVDLGKGLTVPEVCKQLGISQQTYYRWRTKYGGMDPLMAKQLKEIGEAKQPAQEAGGGSGVGHSDSQGGSPPQLIGPGRRESGPEIVHLVLEPDRDPIILCARTAPERISGARQARERGQTDASGGEQGRPRRPSRRRTPPLP